MAQRVGPKPRKKTGQRVGPRRVGAQNFALSFPSLAAISLFLISLCVFFVGFLVVFGSAGAVKCARLEFSGCRVKPGRPRSRRGSHHNPRAQTCTIEGPGLHKNHQNSTRRCTVSDKNRAKLVAGDGKKKAKFWAVLRRGVPPEGGPGEGCPAQRGPNHHQHEPQPQQQRTTRNNKHTPTPTNTPTQQHRHNNNNNSTIWRGSVLTGEEPPPHSGELNALTQAGGPTQSQLSRH